MPSWATQFLEIHFQKPCEAVLLEQQTPDVWCGLNICHTRPHRHHNILILLVYGGTFDPSTIPPSVTIIKKVEFKQNGHLPNFEWPDWKHSQLQKPVILFERNSHART